MSELCRLRRSERYGVCDDAKPLPLIGAVVDAALQTLFLELGVDHSGPRLPPMFQRFRASPVGGGNSVKEGLAILTHDAVPVLVQTVDAPLFIPHLPLSSIGRIGQRI